MNAYTVEIENDQFKDEIYRGPKGSAKIIKGHPGWNEYKWRIYFFDLNKLQATEWANIKTRKECRRLAAEYVIKGYCG